jgi:hypothetical protein
MSFLSDVSAKIAAHKRAGLIVAALVFAGAVADHFLGSAVVSGLVADLLAAGAPAVP